MGAQQTKPPALDRCSKEDCANFSHFTLTRFGMVLSPGKQAERPESRVEGAACLTRGGIKNKNGGKQKMSTIETSDALPEANATTLPAKKRSGLGVGGKLYLAIGGMFAITTVAAGVASRSAAASSCNE